MDEPAGERTMRNSHYTMVMPVYLEKLSWARHHRWKDSIDCLAQVCVCVFDDRVGVALPRLCCAIECPLSRIIGITQSKIGSPGD